MAKISNPSELARLTLQRLAQRQLPPTPDNYLAIYNEIAGTDGAHEGFPEKQFKQIVQALPRTNPEQLALACAVEDAVRQQNWPALTEALVQQSRKLGSTELAWSSMLQDLLTQYEQRHANVNLDEKREGLLAVLSGHHESATQLFQRLQQLPRQWSGHSNRRQAQPHVDQTHVEQAAVSVSPIVEGTPIFREEIATLLENSGNLLRHEVPDLRTEALALAEQIRTVERQAQASLLLDQITLLSRRLQWAGEDQRELQHTLASILQLMLQNISELIQDDHWLSGQIEVLREVISGPLNTRQLEDVEQKLKQIIQQQGSLKSSLSTAKSQLREMLSTFVSHLGDFTNHASDYENRLEDFSVQIAGAESISQLGEVIQAVLHETNVIRTQSMESRDRLTTMRHEVNKAEEEINRLQCELEQTSRQMRHDQLTGALNRKGLEESFMREQARAARRSTPMCLAVLDIDNFKRLNDNYGHQTGDEALIYLADVVRNNLRPQDTLARFGGEEFVVILPETTLDEAVSAMARLQRLLTKTFFLAKSEKLLITFSAGVTLVTPDDTQTGSIARADEAMYQAKREGKNRVIAAQSLHDNPVERVSG